MRWVGFCEAEAHLFIFTLEIPVAAEGIILENPLKEAIERYGQAGRGQSLVQMRRLIAQDFADGKFCYEAYRKAFFENIDTGFAHHSTVFLEGLEEVFAQAAKHPEMVEREHVFSPEPSIIWNAYSLNTQNFHAALRGLADYCAAEGGEITDSELRSIYAIHNNELTMDGALTAMITRPQADEDLVAWEVLVQRFSGYNHETQTLLASEANFCEIAGKTLDVRLKAAYESGELQACKHELGKTPEPLKDATGQWTQALLGLNDALLQQKPIPGRA